MLAKNKFLKRIAWHISRHLPQGWGIVYIEGDGAACYGLDEKERDTLGINLVPVWFLNDE